MKLRNKTFIFITPLIIVPILLIGALAFVKFKQTTEDRLNTQVITLLDQISQYVTNKISVAEANLHILSEHELVVKYALTDDESVRYEILLPHLLNVFKSIENSIEDYYEIRFILPDGFEDVYWADSGIENINEYINEKEYFKEIQNLNNSVFKRLIFDENTQQFSFLLVKDLMLFDAAVDSYGAPAKLRGYIALTVKLDHLKNEINKNLIGKTGFLLVMNEQGKISLVPDEGSNEVSREFLLSLIKSKARSIAEMSGSYVILYNKEPVHIYSKDLPAGMKLLGVLPDKEMLDSSRELGKLVVLITLVAILITMVAVFFALRQLILHPIDTLSNAAQAIGKGQLDLDIKINSKDEFGSLAHSFMDMSKSLRQTHEEVSYTANHDALTGLPNRSMFQGHLHSIITIAKQKEYKIALLFLDLDDFKQVNDTMGHQAGDVLLQEVAVRLSTTLRKEFSITNKSANKASDMVARLGGDEFIILLNEIDGPFDASAVADRILKTLENPIDVQDTQVYVNCSIGITLYPEDANNSTDLIKHADIAMYHAKEQGKNHYQFYSQKLNTDMQKRLLMNSRMRAALENDSFFLFYQPKIDARSSQVIGLEALIRWDDAELGMISPAVFIPIAEESGLITGITEWVFNEVSRQCMEWKNSGVDIVPVAVNVSSIQFKRRDLIAMINTSLQKTGLSYEYIEVELTETSLLTDTSAAIVVLNGLHDLGVSIALDDFGTGYSSLSYLNQLPIHTLKIDRSFINNIKSPDEEYAIVDAVIALAHALDLQVVAEGVENSTQLEYLRNRDCDVIQGYYLSKPLPRDKVPEFINKLKQLN